MPHDKKYWFSRKRYGYGWTPSTTRGWLAILLYVIVVILGANVLLKDVPDNTYTKEVGYFLGFTALATAILYISVRKRSPKAKWQWGKKN